MKYELALDGMTCLDCAKSLEKALASLPGVERAEVSYGAKRGIVLADERVTPDALRQAVVDTGYRAEIVGDPTTTSQAGATATRTRATPPLPRAGCHRTRRLVSRAQRAAAELVRST